LADLGWQAPFTDAQGRRSFIREHVHKHADYLAAFRAANLNIVDCVEPVLTSEHVRAKRRVFEWIPEATSQAYAGLPGVLVWLTEKEPTNRY
jgi:hypothetical protein